jgi:hypothetical protein
LYVHQAAQAAGADDVAVAEEWKDFLKPAVPRRDWQRGRRKRIGVVIWTPERPRPPPKDVEKNRRRMDYPRDLVEGLRISSGAIEAGGKQVINARFVRLGW